MLEIIEPGEHVMLIGQIEAVVTAVLIEDGPRISYKCLWPNGASLCEQWVSAFALQRTEPRTMHLGFARKPA